ncbi:MAG: amidase [Deltaproteobacteria bacterium]|nr:amidase [Deltaproteobacteria bacterium]MBW2361566.1 amidase [Deltaproteobacteria bacterium]
MINDVLDLDGLAQAEHVRRGDVSAVELVEASIARIETLNPALNAVIHPLFDKAIAQVTNEEIGPGAFHGVPFVVKDAVCHTAGDPFHCGMRVLKEFGYKAREDTELARRFRAAGFVFVGKTNTPELALSATTEPLAYGATHNPWQREHSPGGSSGGSAAAVASRMVAAGHANDMGGSIRLPAAFCGLVGLKPTRGRSTLAPNFGEYWGPLTHEHVVSRSVRDSAAILDAIAGPAIGDPYSAPAPSEPFLEALRREPGSLRIGLVQQSGSSETHPDCLRALHTAAVCLEEMGHRVAPLSLAALDEVVLGPWIPAGLARDLDRWSEVIGRPIGPDDVEPFSWLMAEAGRGLDGAQFVEQTEIAFDWNRRFCNEWEPFADVLLLPTSPVPPPRLGTLAPNVALPELAQELARLTSLTSAFDLTGQPAISLPLDWNAAGLPIGVQLAAPVGREDRLFQLAARLEEAHPWADRRPSI